MCTCTEIVSGKIISNERGVLMSKYSYDSNSGDYLTPPSLISDLLNELGRDRFDCDVCCSKGNIPASSHFTLDGFYVSGIKLGVVNGLEGGWSPLNWMNPPFNQCAKWIKKAYEEQQNGNTTYSILPVRTETKYWHDYILFNPDVEIRWLKKGLKFLAPDTEEEMGVFKNALAVVIFKGKK